MFIDEGFGSLSDETRIQAINILNDPSEEKMLAGIISHVTELKAQIETKFFLNSLLRILFFFGSVIALILYDKVIAKDS